MFDQGQLGSGLQLAKVYLIHEGPDEEYAAAGPAQEILRFTRVRQSSGVQAFALIGDLEHKRRSGVLKIDGNLLGRIVFVAMQHGVDGGFAHRHGDTKGLILIQASPSGKLLRGGFNLADALHGRAQ